MDDFYKQMQQFTAVGAVTQSTVRGLKKKGILSKIRGYLARIDLNGVPKQNADEFGKWLNRWTNYIKKKCKCSWGTARKAVNLFLRACFYNHYLRRKYGLGKVEKWLEIPLDNFVAKHFKQHNKNLKWSGILNLDAKESGKFQEYSKEYARKYAQSFVHRAKVHLDIYIGPSAHLKSPIGNRKSKIK